jgi:hypothetical protein
MKATKKAPLRNAKRRGSALYNQINISQSNPQMVHAQTNDPQLKKVTITEQGKKAIEQISPPKRRTSVVLGHLADLKSAEATDGIVQKQRRRRRKKKRTKTGNSPQPGVDQEGQGVESTKTDWE